MVDEHGAQMFVAVLLDLRRIFTETDFRSELSKISLPTVTIHVIATHLHPLTYGGRRTASLISGRQLKVYEGAAHGLPVAQMERLNQDLLAFARS
jgi:non-heme chloroperoxidase